MKYDTVEEFWSPDDLRGMAAHTPRARAEDFLGRLASWLKLDAPIRPAHSGREALRAAVEAACRKRKRVVAVCSFNCRAVAEAVLEAGGQLQIFDLDHARGRIDWATLARTLRDDHAAVVIPHLFGVPSDFRALMGSARSHGVCVIEDCAQCLGGLIDGQPAGALGDAAVFSFGHDKPLSLGGGGGLLVRDPDLGQRVRLRHDPPDLGQEQAEMEAFLAFLTDRRRKIGRAFSRLKRAYDFLEAHGILPDVPFEGATGLGPLRSALGLWQMERLEQVLERRNEVAGRILSASGSSFQCWHVDETVRAAWVRQKVFPTPSERARPMARQLQAMGFRVGFYTWKWTIDRYAGAPPSPNATRAARTGLDVPIHQNLTAEDVERMLEVLR